MIGFGPPSEFDEFMDLSGAELRARLTNRGVPDDVAAELEYRREQYANEIAQILNGRLSDVVVEGG
jgi:hypothetical protein